MPPEAQGLHRRNPFGTPNPDLVQRQFKVDEPDTLWVSDVTEHPAEEGKVYVAVVLDAYQPAGDWVVDR